MMHAESDQVEVETTDTETASQALQAMAERLRQLGIYSACSHFASSPPGGFEA